MSYSFFKDIDSIFPVNKSGPVKIKKVVSGGQIGANSGGLRAAKFMGIKTGGTAPKNYFNENKTKISLLKNRFNLIEEKRGKNFKESLIYCTEKNVVDSDFSLIFGDDKSSESKLTKNLCIKHRKYYFCIDSIEKLFFCIKIFQSDICLYCLCGSDTNKQKEIKNGRPVVVNIAGNRENTNTGIELRTCRFVKRFLQFHG